MRIFLICLMFIASLSGCGFIPIIGPVINAYVVWHAGEGHAYYAADSKTAYKAVKRATEHFDYAIHTDDVRGDGSYYLEVGNNDRFKITITPVEEYITRVSIRINFMGDKPYAELIYLELQDQMDVIDYKKIHRRPKDHSMD